MNDALPALRQAVARSPADFIAWVMLADAELDSGQVAAGTRAAQRALALRPAHPEALARLGRAHWQAGQASEAVALLTRASDAAPQHPGFALWLGHALEDAGPAHAEAAAAAYRRAHQAAPAVPYIAAQRLNWQRRLCDWDGIEALSAQVRRHVASGQAAVEPFAFLSEPATAAEQLTCAARRASEVVAGAPVARPAPAADASPLRIGWLSNGFGNHPTGLLTVALAEALGTHAGCSLHLFSLSPDDGSAITRRLRQAAQLHPVHGMDHRAIAAHIAGTGIDVLFDLRGWGGGGVPAVLAMRPAPVQVNWLAYPGTSGAPWIDWILADAFVLPTALAPHFSEKVLHLPRAFQPSDTTRVVAQPPSRADCGLPAEAVVLCCFNNSYKLNAHSFGRLLAVLAQAPQAVLWLLSGPGLANQRLQASARAAGIDPARLVFMDKLPHDQYLARYHHADLFLDTHPYNAHTTASDALWAGCPLLTTPGRTFASRVAGSLNHHLGMPEMNCSDDAQFIARAIALANDRAALRALRARLASRRGQSGLFDMQAMATDFLQACRQMASGRP